MFKNLINMTSTEESKDVKSWLQSLDLGEFVEIFHNNGYFQLSHCTSLTDNDLTLLGITQTGYKKRILNSISNMNIGKPSLPPRTRLPSSDIQPKPVPPARLPRPPSLDNEEYLSLPSAVGGKNEFSMDKGPHKPTVMPRKSVRIHSTKPDLPPRAKPKPSPRKRANDIANSTSQPEILEMDEDIPNIDELLLRPLPPVPDIPEPTETLSEMSPAQSEAAEVLLPPLPARPSVGLDDPPKIPERPLSSDNGPLPSVRPLYKDPPPVADSQTEAVPLLSAPMEPDFPPPPPLPSRTSPDHVAVPLPPPVGSDETAAVFMRRMSDVAQTKSPPLPPQRIVSSDSILQRPTAPGLPSSGVPPIPVRPPVPYTHDVSSSSDSDESFDQRVLIDRPVPIPPIDATIEEEFDVDRPVPVPPIQGNEYHDLLIQDNVENNRSLTPGAAASLHHSLFPASISENKSSSDDMLVIDDQSKSVYDILISNKPLDNGESIYDTPPIPRMESQQQPDDPEYNIVPSPRKANEVFPEAERESIYDSPSSNQRASLDVGEQMRIHPPPLPGPHMFSARQSAPPMYTNVSSARNSTSSETFNRDSKDEAYLYLSDVVSGRPLSGDSQNGHQSLPIPPQRQGSNQEDYILLSDTSSGKKELRDAIPPPVHEEEDQFPSNVTYSVPNKFNSPIKPGRPAPPPPPVRKSSLTSQSSPTRRSPSYTDSADDVYHLVDQSRLSGSPTQSLRELESEDSEEDGEPDEVDDATSSIEEQRMKDLNRISNCSMGQGDHLQRQEFLRRSTREMRKSMHQRTLQKVSETYQKLPQDLKEGQDAKPEKSGYMNLYSNNGSQTNRGFKKRYIVFRNGELRYYPSEKELNVSKGIIPVGTMRDVKYITSSGNKERSYKLDLYTNGKTLNFATDNLDDCIKWASTLMQSILSYNLPPGGFPIGGNMSSPDKEGYLKFEGVSAKRYVAVKGEMLCIYKSKMDFDAAVAICDIEMKLANVKEVAKSRLQLTTPSSMYFLSADSPIETSQWRSAFEEAIQEGLSSRQFLETVWQNSSNKYCAECSMRDPDWASINLGIVICKACSGCHRNLGVHISKVRSLKMDEKVWTEDLLGMMINIGNQTSNAFWEGNLQDEDEIKLHPGDTFEDRQVFIEAKYKHAKYCAKVEVERSFLNRRKSVKKSTLSRSLILAVENENLRECLRLVFSGADPQFKNESGRSALDIAQDKHLRQIHELLKQNCDILDHMQPTSKTSKLEIPIPPPKETSQESIKLSGYLYKTGSNRRDFQKRFCVLEHGVFKYYADEKAQIPKNQIEGSEMILIAVALPRSNHQFCFELCASTGRAYLFAADSAEERAKWMVALAKCQTLDCMWSKLQGYQFAGFLKKKEGAASTQWQRLWFILHGKFMYFFSAVKNSEDYIDLRKLKSVSVDESDSEEQKKISFVMPKMNLYLTAETDQARDLWYQQIVTTYQSAGPNLDDQPLSDDDVPLIITACINFVEDNEGLETEGIYRKSGSSTAIKKITSLFLEDPRSVPLALKEGEYDVHDVTSSMKKYFRELPEPLLTKDLYQAWIGAAAEEHQDKLFCYKDLLESLPSINYAIIKDLLCHLKKVLDNEEKTCMSASNLGTVFGPTLMASSDPSSTTFQSAEKEIHVILELITYCDWLFNIQIDTLTRDKEQKLQAAKDLLNSIESQPVDSEFIVEIFHGRKPLKGDASSFSIKISDSTTAQQLIQKSIEQNKVKYKPNLAVFEIVCKGDMERLLHSYEYVLQDIMGWHAEFGSNAANYMCIMEDYLTPKVELYMKVLSSSDFVKFQEGKKNYRKMYFELNQNVLNAYKDKSSPSMAYQWKVAEMKIYFGHDRKKSPPTQHCIAFTTLKEQGFKHLSFETQEALHTWLGAFFKSKTQLAPVDDIYEDESGRDPHNPLKRVTQITSHLRRWSRSPMNQSSTE
ncbi:arf-GAP with Rho-GAP domain, ANK repeat and PH domain-containing protein 1-like isoform X4 [Apostichopus japonicus]|uniref:arf-GAP with Rho-GAP domain, ANK repeat and PH domain-containing protein 1-like isoform X4 n=1 Tax=Stichopus japonicus TaxID=307972 RepID=UPI003AB54CFB